MNAACDKPAQEIRATWGDKSLSARGNQVIGIILGLIISGLLSWSIAIGHAHDAREAETKVALLNAIKEQTKAAKDLIESQERNRREIACLLRVAQSNRASLCSDISK